ncbi:hypothetical protein GGX14DRAFT_596731, partial [Mycena pura]
MKGITPDDTNYTVPIHMLVALARTSASVRIRVPTHAGRPSIRKHRAPRLVGLPRLRLLLLRRRRRRLLLLRCRLVLRARARAARPSLEVREPRQRNTRRRPRARPTRAHIRIRRPRRRPLRLYHRRRSAHGRHACTLHAPPPPVDTKVVLRGQHPVRLRGKGQPRRGRRHRGWRVTQPCTAGLLPYAHWVAQRRRRRALSVRVLRRVLHDHAWSRRDVELILRRRRHHRRRDVVLRRTLMRIVWRLVAHRERLNWVAKNKCNNNGNTT